MNRYSQERVGTENRTTNTRYLTPTPQQQPTVVMACAKCGKRLTPADIAAIDPNSWDEKGYCFMHRKN